MTKVSVLIAVYNTEKYLHECLDSLLHQTLEEWEAICVDDSADELGSMDLPDFDDLEATSLGDNNFSNATETSIEDNSTESLNLPDFDDLEATSLETENTFLHPKHPA